MSRSKHYVGVLASMLLLVVLAGCSSHPDPDEDIKTNNIFQQLSNTSWGTWTQYGVDQVYFSPSGNGVMYTFCSATTGYIDQLYGKSLNGNTAVYPHSYFAQEVSDDYTCRFELKSENQLIANYYYQDKYLSDINYYRIRRTIACKIDQELTASDLDITENVNVAIYPKILVRTGDNKLVTNGEGMATLRITYDNDPEHNRSYLIQLNIRPYQYKKTDIMLLPYEVCLGMTPEEVVENLGPGYKQKNDDYVGYSRIENDRGFIEHVVAAFDETGSYVQYIQLALNENTDWDGLKELLDSLYRDPANFEEDGVCYYRIVNQYGYKCWIIYERAEAMLYYLYSDSSDPSTGLIRLGFGEDILLN